MMDRRRRRPGPPAIDITWLSCRGVRSSLPFHTPCLYASVSVVPSSAGKTGQRRHRVKTPTDRAGGGNPEWDTPLRLYLPGASPPAPEPEARRNDKDKGDDQDDDDDVLLVRFELKAEVAVLGDVLAASAAVPVPDLVADGRTRRISYQLVGPDGRQPNGVISFSYTFQESNNADEGGSSDGELAVTPRLPAASASAVALPPPTAAAAPRLYPAIEWALTEHIPVYPPVAPAKPTTAGDMPCYPPPQPATVYPPLPETSPCFVYPPSKVAEPATGMYPTVDLAPVSCYPPPPPQQLYGVGFGYAPAPGWDDRCLHYG